MISTGIVFDSVRRGYNELETSSNSEILNYFDGIEPDAMVGHISNIKGIVFEHEIVNALNEQGLDAMMFEATNHPISDIALMSDGDIAAEMQLKATDSVSYINETLAQHSDIPIITTSEVADGIDSVMVIDSGLDNSALNDVVTETLFGEAANEAGTELVSDMASDAVSEGLAGVIGESILPIPISPLGLIGAIFGLPFL